MEREFVKLEFDVPDSLCRRVLFHAAALHAPEKPGIASLFERAANFVYHFSPRAFHESSLSFSDESRSWSMNFPLFDAIKVDYTRDLDILCYEKLYNGRNLKSQKRFRQDISLIMPANGLIPPGSGLSADEDSFSFRYEIMLNSNIHLILKKTAPYIGELDGRLLDTAFKYYESFWWHKKQNRQFVDKSDLLVENGVDDVLLKSLKYN